jgi:predicted nucleic acid-binding protein
MYLLDTVVLSELRKRQIHPSVVRWFAGKTPGELFVSTMTIGEIERGIDRQRERNPIFAEALESWLDRLLADYAERILPVNIAVARRWGRLTARIGHRSIDLLLAATALEHRLTVVTRYVRDFVPTGVVIEDPFAAGD